MQACARHLHDLKFNARRWLVSWISIAHVTYSLFHDWALGNKLNGEIRKPSTGSPRLIINYTTRIYNTSRQSTWCALCSSLWAPYNGQSCNNKRSFQFPTGMCSLLASALHLHESVPLGVSIRMVKVGLCLICRQKAAKTANRAVQVSD